MLHRLASPQYSEHDKEAQVRGATRRTVDAGVCSGRTAEELLIGGDAIRAESSGRATLVTARFEQRRAVVDHRGVPREVRVAVPPDHAGRTRARRARPDALEMVVPGARRLVRYDIERRFAASSCLW